MTDQFIYAEFLRKNATWRGLLQETAFCETCIKCAFFDKNLDERQQYRCRAGKCPDVLLDSHFIDTMWRAYESNC